MCRPLYLASIAAALSLFAAPHAAFAQSEAERLEKLERAVEQLQKRNAELEQEVKSLKKRTAFAPEFDADGNKRPKVVSDGKTSVEKTTVAEEKKPVYVVQAGPELKLTLGGYI